MEGTFPELRPDMMDPPSSLAHRRDRDGASDDATDAALPRTIVGFGAIIPDVGASTLATRVATEAGLDDVAEGVDFAGVAGFSVPLDDILYLKDLFFFIRAGPHKI